MDDVRKYDLAIMLVWPFLAVLISLLFNVDYLGSIFLFLLLPSLFLSIHEKDSVAKILGFSLLIGVFGTVIIDYLGHASGLWYINSTVFSFRFYGVFPAESFLWGIFSVYLPLIFYQRFLKDQDEVDEVIPSRMEKAVEFLLPFTLLAFVFMALIPTKVDIPNLYWIICPIFLLGPVVFEFIEYRRHFRKVFEAGIYFFLYNLAYELTALKLNIWKIGTGSVDFVGWFNLLGFSLPLEEVLFYMVLFSMAMISSYDQLEDYVNH